MNKNILFLTIFSALFSHIHIVQAMDTSKKPSTTLDAIAAQLRFAAFKEANPLPERNMKYIPFMGTIYSVTITDPVTNRSYADHDNYPLYCARQRAANNPEYQAEYYLMLQARLNYLRSNADNK